jgi:hypothetical protein
MEHTQLRKCPAWLPEIQLVGAENRLQQEKRHWASDQTTKKGEICVVANSVLVPRIG